MIGPLYFFSDAGGFVAPNPVKQADITLDLIIARNVSSGTIGGTKLTSEVPYLIYENKNPFLR